jgi:hypothetical protein
MRINVEKIILTLRYPVVLAATIAAAMVLNHHVEMFHAGTYFGWRGYLALFATAIAYWFLAHFLFPDPEKYGRYVRERNTEKRGGTPLDRRKNGDYYQ